MENTILLKTSGQKKRVHLDILLLCCGTVCLLEKRLRKSYDALFQWKKMHLLQEMQGRGRRQTKAVM